MVRYTRLGTLTKPTSELIVASAKGLTFYDDWPFTGDLSERIAPMLLPQLLQGGGTFEDWAQKWFRKGTPK